MCVLEVPTRPFGAEEVRGRTVRDGEKEGMKTFELKRGCTLECACGYL